MLTPTTPLTLDLTGRVAVVTGATGQLGRVMVRTLAQCGADVAINYRQNRDMAAQLQAEAEAMGRRALAVQADVTDKAAVLAMRDQVTNALGAADIIVNNAVIQYDWTSVLEQSPEDYEGQFRSCVLHNVLMAQAFVPGMIAAGKGGRVIGINTECAMQNFPSQSAYVAGKRGMDGVLRISGKRSRPARHHGQPGRAGLDDQRSGAQEGSEDQPGYSASVPLRRRGTDQEIANVVAFLASDLASYVTGVYVPVCGGNVMPAI